MRRHYVSAAKALGIRNSEDGNRIVLGAASDIDKASTTQGFVPGTPAANLSESFRYTELSNGISLIQWITRYKKEEDKKGKCPIVPPKFKWRVYYNL